MSIITSGTANSSRVEPPAVRLDGKVAVITGAGSGVGRASAILFAAAGARVLVANRTGSKAEAVVATIRAAGGEALAVEADVSQSADVQRMIAAAVVAWGGLDILFNNAGISPSGTVTAISEADWAECLGTNLTGVFLGCKYAIPEMQKRGGGVILTTAGTFGIRPARDKAAYSAAKAGAISLSGAVALDYARDNIRSNAICPGYVDTPLNAGFPEAARDAFLAQYQPLRGLITPEEVAGLALYLCSDAAHMITGQAFIIDGGQQAGLFA